MNDLPRRRQLRLKDYDYSQPGYYFITICAEGKTKYFWLELKGVDDPAHPFQMQSNKIGDIVCECWNKINELYDGIKTDSFCLMPNHIHGIIVIENAGGQGRPPLQKIIQGFKSVTTRMCFKYNFQTIWQRGYYEHIIRAEEESYKIKEYIENNALKWQDDKYYI